MIPTLSRGDPMRIDDLSEILNLFANLARLRFPIESPHAISAQLPRGRISLRIGASRVDLRAIIEDIPAYYFPITSIENFAVKAQQFFDENEHRIGVPVDIAPLVQRVGASLRYPVNGIEPIREAARSNGISSITYAGRTYSVDHVLAQFRRELFPIRDAHELYSIARRFSQKRM
jgi:hypothetical protein